MAKLHIFNPENDLALAADVAQYTPPPAAVSLRLSGALLPLWWADPLSDFVLVPPLVLDEARFVAEKFSLATPVSPASLLHLLINGIAPWGWSKALCNELRHNGLSNDILPSDSHLDELRMLSSRLTTIELFRRLPALLPYPIPPPPRKLATADDCKSALSENRSLFIKAPWSSSGRGVFCTSSMTCDDVVRRCQGIIRRQGFVISEQALDKVQDFAMLYESDGCGHVTFVGYSLFQTNSSLPAYSGNVLMDDNKIVAHLSRISGIDPYQFLTTKIAVGKALSEIVGYDYQGPLGVDMMIYRDGAEMRINPCVEINLRRTMGFVAHDLRLRLLPEDVTGYFSVAPHVPESGKTLPPPRFTNGKLTEGRLFLSPASSPFDITVSVGSD